MVGMVTLKQEPALPPCRTVPAQEYTQKKVSDFLHNHTAYELIPESGKVVVLDVDLPMRQAFHALNEQVGGEDSLLEG